jgi:hypothetical protein
MTEIEWSAPLDLSELREILNDFFPNDLRVYDSCRGRGERVFADSMRYRGYEIRNRTTKPANAPSPELVESLKSMRDHLDLARNRIRATAINFSGLDEPRSYEASYWANEADEHVKQFDAILAELEPVDPDEALIDQVLGDHGGFDARTEAMLRDAIKRVRAEKG